MSSKTFSVLAAIAALLSIYSYMVAGDQPVADFTFVAGRKLIPSIDTDRLSSIEVEGWGMKTLLTRQGDSYVVSNRNNYPAASRSYSELVRSVLKASCDEEVTADRARHADLWVNWPSGRNHRVRFLDADGNELVGLIVGNTIEDKLEGHHIRLTSSDVVFRSDNSLPISSDPLIYLDKRLIPCRIPDIQRIDLSDGKVSYSIDQGREGVRQLIGVPPNMKSTGGTFANIMTRAPAMEFEDFAPRAEKAGLNYDHSFKVVLRNNMFYELRSAKDGDEYWVIADAQYFGDTSPKLDANSTVEEIRRATELEEAFYSAAAFNAQHSAFAYRVHDRYAFFLRHPLSILIEPK